MPDFTIDEVCSMPRGCVADAVTSDGHVVAFWPQPDGRLRFVWDGVAGRPFDGLGANCDKTAAFVSSGDGAHFAYSGYRGDRYFVGRDGGEDPPVEALSRSVPPVFSGDGRHLAYGARSGTDHRLIVDGEMVGELPVAPIAAVFSPDGERLAFVEMRNPTGGTAEFRIVLDGVAGSWIRGMRNNGAMQFSPDSRRFAYCEIDRRGQSRWIVDGVAQRLTKEVPSIGLAQLRGVGVLEAPLAACFSPDGRRFAYFADVAEKGVAIIEDDVPGPPFKAVSMPVFSPDSRRLAYTALTYKKTVAVVVDGVVIGEWRVTRIGDPVFDAGSRHVAFTMQRKEGILRKRELYSVVLDGSVVAEEAGDDASARPSLSPAGDRIAWWVGWGGTERLLLVNDYVVPGLALFGEPLFTGAGLLVYPGTNGDAITIVRGDHPGPFADEIAGPRTTMGLAGRSPSPDHPFSVSPDGQHVAWAGVFGLDIRPVIDDLVGPTFDVILDWTFDDGGTATWWAQRGEVVYRVTRYSLLSAEQPATRSHR